MMPIASDSVKKGIFSTKSFAVSFLVLKKSMQSSASGNITADGFDNSDKTKYKIDSQ